MDKKKGENKDIEPTAFRLIVNYEDDLSLSESVIHIYVLQQKLMNNHIAIQDRHIRLLSYYLVHGFNTEVIKEVAQFYDKSLKKVNYIRTLNTELTNLGFLVKDGRNHKIKHLNSVLIRLKQYFLNPDDPHLKKFAIIFNYKQNEKS